MVNSHKRKKIKAKSLIEDFDDEDISLVTIKDDIKEVINFQPWFNYDFAEKTIKKLAILHNESVVDKELRPLAYFVCGQINSGKTTLVTRFRSLMRKLGHEDIIYYSIPVRATLKKVFADILHKAFNKEIAGTALKNFHTQDILNRLIIEMEQNQTKVLIIDELQDLLVSSSEDKREIFKGFKHILNNCGTRLILVGTKKAKELMYIEDWIDDRLRLIELPDWGLKTTKKKREFAQLILQIYIAYQEFVPDWKLVTRGENGKAIFNESEMKLLITLSKGRLGRLIQLIRYGIIEALLDNRKYVKFSDYHAVFNHGIKFEINRNGDIVRILNNQKKMVKNSNLQ